ncbi:SAM-dependent methyltransferase [Aquicoccus sp. G2-2]|uniref:SAM-dependent methyltransferase n=1 Tax=Aquicoccus sp. G2-2 TaxID=3092120 RepID=UPI002AE00B52|nr:SAM-dependent methyltransferase [Aquicoccus sp. G2-2]MEA1114572.1 SAM-dependent methyltransferase [Aquicoccus sp. G2-2]
MTNSPTLTNYSALARNRMRANKAFEPFLHRLVADEIKDRLSMIKKSFNAPGIVTGYPGFWGAEIPDGTVVSDEDTLSFVPGGHDLVVHAMALHWANDPVGQLIQCRHALQSDGLFMAALFGGRTLHELRASLAQAESEISGGLSPRVAPMAEIRDLGDLLQRAGFALPVADSLLFTASYQSPWHLMRELRAMGEQNALSGRLEHFSRRKIFDRAVQLYINNFGGTDGRIPATFEVVFLVGWAPDPSQPQPLRPGSARARLADALGVAEVPVKD